MRFHTIRDGNWTRGCGHPRVLDPMSAGADPKIDSRVHPHPPETNKAEPKWSKPSPICVIYISEILVYLSLSVSPLPHPAAARRLGAHHPHSPSQFPPLTSLPRLPALPLQRGMASVRRLPLRRRISPPQARPAAAGGLHLRRAAAGSLPRRPDLSTTEEREAKEEGDCRRSSTPPTSTKPSKEEDAKGERIKGRGRRRRSRWAPAPSPPWSPGSPAAT